ncbi:MAG: hypothetical protein QM769_03120 [Pseudoxanthomonas sp.]
MAIRVPGLSTVDPKKLPIVVNVARRAVQNLAGAESHHQPKQCANRKWVFGFFVIAYRYADEASRFLYAKLRFASVHTAHRLYVRERIAANVASRLSPTVKLPGQVQ